MLVARVYSVLNSLSVEVSCVHGADPMASHLVVRELVTNPEDGVRGALLALSDVALGAACRMRLEDEQGVPLGLAECDSW